ncbi:MAG: transposase [Candidatus Aminicenantes bacterium RBG_13_59_9]|nr:MAG: transposase [Candidatus Aminicenantes bacterium RBG_13_59_9]
MFMNKLNKAKQAQVVAALCEGNSIRATVRMTGVAKNTIVKLLADLGLACAEYQDKVFRNLPCKKIQCDEIWSFCYAKEKNVPKDKKGQFGYGDVWTFTAICADTRLVPSWHIGRRDLQDAIIFMKDLAGRLASRIQLTTDGHKMYLEAVEGAFGGDVDFSQLVKIYGQTQEGQKRYSPPQCIGTIKTKIIGKPDSKDISTSYVERQNLTMRMNMRRFTRLTNAFSKKVENLFYAVSLHFMYYNFCRIHQTLRVTPAMEAKVADHVWTIEEIISLMKT